MGMLGALAGGAGAFTTIADDHIKQWNEKDLMAAKQQAEIAREKRIEEASIRSEGRQESSQIRTEGRAAEAHKAQRKDDLNFNTDPNNVTAQATAETTRAGLLDKYKDEHTDSRLEADVARARALDAATYHAPHDNTDYEGRALDHQIKQQALDDAAKGGKIPDAVKEQLKAYDTRNKEIKDMLATGAVPADSAGALSLMDEQRENTRDKNALISRYLNQDGESQGGSKYNPAEIGGSNEKASEADIAKASDLIQRINPDNTPIEIKHGISKQDLKSIINDAKANAPKKKGILPDIMASKEDRAGKFGGLDSLARKKTDAEIKKEKDAEEAWNNSAIAKRIKERQNNK